MELLVVAAIVLVVVFLVLRAIMRGIARILRAAERTSPLPTPRVPARGADERSKAEDRPYRDSIPSSPGVGVFIRTKQRPGRVNQARWIPAGEAIVVHSYRIPGGLLFLGEDLPTINGDHAEPALIDPRLPVARHAPNRAGTGMPYWPSYSTISPSERAAYLEWLAAGRADEDTYIGYVFLFFYGLERRVLADPDTLKTASPELDVIANEVRRLLAVYAPQSRSFHRYGTSFLSLLVVATSETARSYERQPPVDHGIGELSLSLRLGLGQAALDAHPLPADWALAWVKAVTPLRTPATRCSDEFTMLFRARYAEAFSAGLRLRADGTKLAWTYQPASASFGGQFTIQFDLPDVTAQPKPLTKLVVLAERCCDELDAYSRWVGRHGEVSGLARVALLPAVIGAGSGSEDVDALWRSIEYAIGAGRQAVIDAGPLVRASPSGLDGKLSKADAILLAEALARRGYGVEPDVRFGGRGLSAPGMAVVFRLPPDAPATPTRSYAAATVLLHLAAVVAHADDAVADAESRHVVDHLQTALHLSDAERARLTAHFAWLRIDPPGNAGMKKRIAAIARAHRERIAKFLVTLAAADGHIATAELAALTKIYRLLGLDPQSAYRAVHALGEQTSDEPVTIRPASPVRDFAIPAQSREAAVTLDMQRVAHTLAETATVTALLDDIFDEDDEAAIPTSRPASGSTAAAESALLRALGERLEWSRLDFERLAEALELLPDGALERLNEAALDRFGAPLSTGDDPIVIDTALAKEMLHESAPVDSTA